MKQRFIELVGFALFIGLTTGCSAPEVHPSQDPKSAIVDPSKVRPVTEKMQIAAAHCIGMSLADKSLPDENGKPSELLQKPVPTLVFMLHKDCPCCVECEPFINQIAAAFGDKMNLIALGNTNPTEAKKWKTANKFSGTVFCDPKLQLIGELGVEAGAEVAITDAQGKIVEAFPGYSATTFQKIADKLAELLNVKSPQIKTTGAPDNLTSGCLFRS